MVNQGFFSASRLNEEKNKANRFAGEKENTIARVDGPSTPIGSEYGLGSLNINRGATFPVNIRPKKGFTLDDVYGIKKVEADFVSPRGNEVGQIASSDLTNLRVGSPEVRLASVKSYIPDVTKPYAPDDVGDYIRDTEEKSYKDTRTEDEKGRDAIKKFFTREEEGVFKNEDEFNRKMTTYYTDRDGNPAAVNAFGEKVDYGTDTIKRYIATDAKEKYQAEQKRKLDQGLATLQDQKKQVDDFNYYKRNLDFNEKGEANPANKYVLTAPQMRERMKQLGPNETMDKYGIIRPVNTERYKSFSTEDTRKLGTMPSMGISEAGREEARLNRLQKEKDSSNTQENRSILQRVGDFLGGAVNTAIGAGSAEARTLDAQKAQEALNIASSLRDRSSVGKPDLNRSGTDTSATVNIGGRGGSSRSNTGSNSASRGTAGSRSRGGVSRGSSKSNTGSKSTARGARGSANSRSKGGTGSGRTSTSRTASKASKGRTGRSRTRCDIRTKINISPLINSNLVKDNLAEVAYFVQEIKK